MTSRLSWSLVGLMCVLTVGCDALDELAESGEVDYRDAGLIGVDDSHVFYEYFTTSGRECNDWGWCDYPSSLWAFDLATGQSKRIQKSKPRLNAQAAGDYFVSEEERTGRVVGGRISTGERTTIVERNPHLDFWGEQHMLDGERVAVLTAGRLSLFDLPAQAATWTFNLPLEYTRLLAFKSNQVVVANEFEDCGDASLALINTTDDEMLEIPAPPGGIRWVWGGCEIHLSQTWLALNGCVRIGANRYREAILAFHIPTESWQVLGEYGRLYLDGYFPDWSLRLLGGDETHVFVEIDHYVETENFIKMIELSSGDAEVICDVSEMWIGDNILHNRHLYWIDDYATGELAILDLDSGRVQLRPLGGPFDD